MAEEEGQEVIFTENTAPDREIWDEQGGARMQTPTFEQRVVININITWRLDIWYFVRVDSVEDQIEDAFRRWVEPEPDREWGDAIRERAGLVGELRAGGVELAGPASVADADDLPDALEKHAWECSVQGISCQLHFLPMMVPLRSSLAAGIAVLDCDRLQAPEDVIGGLLADVLDPGQTVVMRDGKRNGNISHRVWLSWMSTLLLRCGFELVAPEKFAAKAAVWDDQRSDLYDAFRSLAMGAQDLPLIFLPGAQLTADQTLFGDVQIDKSSQPHSHLQVEISTSGLATLREAPQVVKDLVLQAFPWSSEDNLAKLCDARQDFLPKVHMLILAAVERLGYQLVAPAALAASVIKRQGEHTDFRQIAREASSKQLSLVFLPRASLCTERHLFAELSSREGFHPSGMVTVNVDAMGVATLHEAPQDMRDVLEKALPWSQGSCAPKVHVLLLSSINQLGYKLVAPKDLTAELGALGPKQLLVFLPSASLTIEQCAQLDIQSVETFSPSGHVRIDFSPTNVATLLDAPSELRRVIQEAFPWGKYLFELSFAHECILASIQRLGYELVAPRTLAAHMVAGEGEQADLQQLAHEAPNEQLSLVFLPRSSLSLEPRLLVELRSREDFCPSGVVTVEVDAKGVPTLLEAPEDVGNILAEAFPWSRGSTLSVLKSASADVAPVVRMLVLAAIERLGYELVAPRALAARVPTMEDERTDFQQIVREASNEPLTFVFLPRASLRAEQRLIPEFQSWEDFRPSGVVTVELDAKGIPSLVEAPDGVSNILAEAFPWSRGSTLSVLKSCPTDLAPKMHAVFLVLIKNLGYELVAPKALAASDFTAEGEHPYLEQWAMVASSAQLPFVFLPQASLSAERCLPIDFIAKEGFRPSSMVTMKVDPKGIATLLEAPQDVQDILGKAVPWSCGSTLASLKNVPVQFAPKVQELMLLAMERLGYERVAPEELYSQPMALDASSSELLLVFLPRATLTTDQRVIIDVESMADYCPPGRVKIEVSTTGVATLLEAPDELKSIVEEAFPWSHGERLSKLKDLSLDLSPKVHEVVLASIERLGYGKVTGPSGSAAGTYRFLRPIRSPAMAPEHPAVQTVEALKAELEAKIHSEVASLQTELADTHGQLAMQQEQATETAMIKAQLGEALGKIASQKADLGILQEQAEEAALVRAQLREALGKIESQRGDLGILQEQATETALITAQLEEALGKIESQKRDLGIQQAEETALVKTQLGILQEQVGALLKDKREREEAEAAAAQADAASEERGVPVAQGWPVVEVLDVDSCMASAAKHIRIECPGVQEDDVTIEALSNGVHVHIKAPDSSREDFERDFCFTREGFFELREDESSHDLGVVLLVLKATTPPPRRRIRLSSSSRTPLPPVPEEAQGNASRGGNQHPQHFDIASGGPRDVDSQDVSSEAGSWTHFNGGAGACAYPEQDAASVGEESSGQVSQLSSWVVPVDSQRAASRASSSHGSGVNSAATVRSVASAPAKLSTPCCFPPKTRFRSAATGKYVRAGQLKSSGGDRLLGPGGAEVLVRKAIRHHAKKRDLVSLRVKGISGSLVVTADHRLLTRGPDGEQVTCTAGSLAGKFSQGMPCHLHDGSSFQDVEQVDCYSEVCEVVEVTFDGDAVALAWVLPQRSRSIDSEVSVAVKGKEHTPDDDYDVKGTFYCERSKACTRSRSAGTSPLFIGAFSLGSRGHDDDHPERCSVCPKHKGFLKAWNSPNRREARPCPDGERCGMCHEPHGEHVTLRRSRGRGGRRAAEVQPPAEVQPAASSMTGR